jgi:hypothetical protein
MGDFNFGPSVIKMQRRERLARLALFFAGQALEENQQLRLICP